MYYINKKKYKVKECIEELNSKKISSFFICDPYVPVFHIAKFLDIKGKNSLNTQKTYANILCPWMNFLENINIKYYEVTYEHFKNYIHKLIFTDKYDEYSITPTKTYSTIVTYINIIYQFYEFLKSETNNDSFIYIYNDSNTENYYFDMDLKKLNRKIDSSIKLFLTEYKRGRKEQFIMEYSEEDIEIISSNFLCMRDKAIFLLTLMGMRIDEVLSIKVKNIDFSENILYPSRTKSQKNRPVVILNSISILINSYLKTERLEAIYHSGIDSEYLFINIKKNKFCGNQLKYNTFYSSLKRAAKKAGFLPESIRTHSGRSTKAMELLKHKVSDEMIRNIMGWRSIHSISSYIDENNKSLAINVAKGLANSSKNKND